MPHAGSHAKRVRRDRVERTTFEGASSDDPPG